MYARTFNGQDYNFGVVGVDEGTLIMYDAQTQSHWSQLFGQAVNGEMKGEKLEKIPSTMTTWKSWRTLHPKTTVYVKPNAYSRRFTTTNFDHIAKVGSGPLQAEDLIAGFEGHVQAGAYVVRWLAKERIAQDVFENAAILAWLSEDKSTARVFLRRVDEQVLNFELAKNSMLRDKESGSHWQPLTGEAVSGPMQGKKLQPLLTTYGLWFAWEKYRPDTIIFGEP